MNIARHILKPEIEIDEEQTYLDQLDRAIELDGISDVLRLRLELLRDSYSSEPETPGNSTTVYGTLRSDQYGVGVDQ